MPFQVTQKVLFRHCDPAGIVFYPRYFEMVNDCVEAFFAEVLDTPFESLHETGGVPTVQIQTRFNAPSRHGDVLTLSLSVTKIGKTSLAYNLAAYCDHELRFETDATLVNVDAMGRPLEWAAPLRDKLTPFRKDPE